MYTLYELQTALDQYEKARPFYENEPALINNLTKVAFKIKLNDIDQLLILKELLLFSDKEEKLISKNCADVIRGLRDKTGQDNLKCFKILLEKNLFTLENVFSIKNNPLLVEKILYIDEQSPSLIDQNCLDLLICSASGEESEEYLNKRTEHLCCLLIQLGKYQLLDEAKYKVLFEQLKFNQKAIEEIPQISPWIVSQANLHQLESDGLKWSANLSKQLIQEICKQEIDFSKYEHSQFEKIINAFSTISYKGRENYLVFYLKALQLLEAGGLLNPENISLLFDNHNLCGRGLVTCLNQFANNNLLNEENFKHLCSIDSMDLFDLNDLVEYLGSRQLLSRPLFDLLLKPANSEVNRKTIKSLVDLIPLKSEILFKIIQQDKISEINATFQILKKAGLDGPEFSADIINNILMNKSLTSLSEVVEKLHSCKFLNKDSLSMAMNIKETLKYLAQCELHTQGNLRQLEFMELRHLITINSIVDLMVAAEFIVNQGEFDDLLKHANILDVELLGRIPPRLFTHTMLNDLFIRCVTFQTDPNSQQRLAEYIQRIITPASVVQRGEAPRPQTIVLNEAQSTKESWKRMEVIIIAVVTADIIKDLGIEKLPEDELKRLKDEINKNEIDYSLVLKESWKRLEVIIIELMSESEYEPCKAGFWAIDTSQIIQAIDDRLAPKKQELTKIQAPATNGFFSPENKPKPEIEFPLWIKILFCLPIIGQLGYGIYLLLDWCFPAEVEQDCRENSIGCGM